MATLETNVDRDEALLEQHRSRLTQLILEEEKLVKVVEARRMKVDLRETQRRLALAERVPLLSSDAPRPFDSIIAFWQNYAEKIVDPPYPHPAIIDSERPRKKLHRITSSSDLSSSPPLQPSLHSSSSQLPPSDLRSGNLSHNPSKRKRTSSPSRSLPLLSVYQIMNDYYDQKISYEPALEKMRALWSAEADWKPLFDKLTQLEPDDDPSGVLGELNNAIALCCEKGGKDIISDSRVDTMSKNDLHAICAELKLLSHNEILDMLRTKTIPTNIESILISGMEHPDTDSEDDNSGEQTFPPSLDLELDLLSKFLGVSTGLDDGIFLVRCKVRKSSWVCF